MIRSVSGKEMMERNSHTLRPALDNLDHKGKATPQTKAVDYKISFNREVVSTLTYERTGVINNIRTQETEAPGFEDLLARLLERQGITVEEARGGKAVEIDPETRAEARELISENGYWGVDKTSERIVEFAISGAGGDTSKLGEIRAAIEKGFGMAAETLGGSLPEISTKTYDAVMKKLDEWAGQDDLS